MTRLVVLNAKLIITKAVLKPLMTLCSVKIASISSLKKVTREFQMLNLLKLLIIKTISRIDNWLHSSNRLKWLQIQAFFRLHPHLPSYMTGSSHKTRLKSLIVRSQYPSRGNEQLGNYQDLTQTQLLNKRWENPSREHSLSRTWLTHTNRFMMTLIALKNSTTLILNQLSKPWLRISRTSYTN